MANSKKTPVKKTARKPATTKKTTAKTVAKKQTRKKQAKTPLLSRSFIIQAEQSPFVSFRITLQTIYWLIFALAVLTAGLMVLSAHLATEELQATISAEQAMYAPLPHTADGN